MASAAPTASSTKETTNYARLCRLLVDVGTQALRKTFDAIHAPANLHTTLAGNKTTLQSLRARKIINPTQWGKLFPAIPTSVSTAHFDTTLLMVLLRNICGLVSPVTGWDTLPAVTDTSREADIARVKYFRNTVYAHAEQASVDDATFNTYWQDIRDTLVRLGGVQYREAIDNLETECMDPEIEDHYKELLSQWKKDEDNVKDKLDVLGSGIEKVMKRLNDLEGIVSSTKRVTREPVVCKEKYHENEAVEYYCQECEVCICNKCEPTHHNVHDKADIQQAADERKMQMTEVFKRSKAKLVVVETKMKKQIELRKKSDELISAAEKKATKTVEEIIRAAREHETAIKKELAEIKKAQRRDYKTSLENLQLLATQLKRSVEYGEGIVQRNVCLEILQEGHAVLGHCKELLNTQEIKIYKPLHVTYLVNKKALNVARLLIPGHVGSGHTDPTQSVAEGKGLKEAKLGVETNFTITTRDSEGNQFYEEGDQVTLKICSPTGKDDERDIEDCKDGKYTVRYKPKSAGLYNVAVEVNGRPLPCSPWIVQVTPHQYKFLHSIELRMRGKESRKFGRPSSIVVNKKTGNIAIADYNNKRVQLFDSEWKYLRTIGATKVSEPTSVAFTAYGDVIVTHGEATQSGKMSVFTEHGQFLKHISQHLIDPRRVFVTTDGHIIVCDNGNKSIKVLSPDGTELLQSFSAPGCDDPWFAVYHQDTFFVSYPYAHVVKVFSKEGVFLHDIGSEGSGDGQLCYPTGLAIDKFNNLIVCDSGNRIFHVFALDGKFVNNGDRGLDAPGSAAVTLDGDLLICDNREAPCVHVFQ